MRKTTRRLLTLGLLAGLAGSASAADRGAIEISPDKLGTGLFAYSVKTELTELNDKMTHLVVSATFKASNSCMIPTVDELIAISNLNGYTYDLTVGRVRSDRNCPAVFRPVDYEVIVMRTVVAKDSIDDLQVFVNGKAADK